MANSFSIVATIPTRSYDQEILKFDGRAIIQAARPYVTILF